MRTANGHLPRVVHAPIDVGNLASVSVAGLRELGVDARCVCDVHPFGYAQGPDTVIPAGRLARAGRIAAALSRCDVLHLYSGESMFRGRLRTADARLMGRLGRRVVVEFVGTDVRLPSLEKRRNPYFVPSSNVDEEQLRHHCQRWAELCAGHAIVPDHSLDPYLAPYFDHVHVVGQRVDTRRYVPTPPSVDKDVPLIVHAPSERRVKGTDVLRSVLADLRREGAKFEYLEVHGVPHTEALARCARADIVVDQLRVGGHGQFAVEAMAMAKPVICYIQPDLLPRYPTGLPLINANPDTLRGVLEDWIERPRDRHELGLTGRAYVEEHHDARVVARRLLDAYESLPR